MILIEGFHKRMRRGRKAIAIGRRSGTIARLAGPFGNAPAWPFGRLGHCQRETHEN